jgi:hypothetical protein
MVILAWVTIVLASPAVPEPAQPSFSIADVLNARQQQTPSEMEDLRAILSQAQAWQRRGEPFPDALLR